MLLARTVAGVLAGVTAGALLVGANGSPAPAAAPAERTLRIMPLGDSITAGVGSETRSSYRRDLAGRLRAAGLAFDFVGSQDSGAGFDTDNEGHGGWTVDMISDKIDGWLATYRPDVVLVHLGTNNIVRGQAPETVAAKLSALIDRIRVDRPDATVFVSRIVGSKDADEMTAIRTYNALIPGVVADKGDAVRVVDQSGVTGIDLLDKHHPNDFGYAKMAYTFFRALGRVYDTPALDFSAGVDPATLRQAYRCLWRPVVRHGRTVNSVECRTWSLNSVRVRRYGVPTRVLRWQTRRVVTVKEIRTVDGHRVTVRRQVVRWVGAQQFLDV